MQSNPSVQPKQSNRRHDSQFGPDLGHLQAPSTAQPNPAQPRYFPSGAHPQANQYTNHQALPRQGQGARLPTPVIEELNDEPTQKPLPQASGKFNPKPFARNQPGTPGNIKQNKPQAFSATGPAAVDQAMRQAYQAQVAAQAVCLLSFFADVRTAALHLLVHKLAVPLKRPCPQTRLNLHLKLDLLPGVRLECSPKWRLLDLSSR